MRAQEQRYHAKTSFGTTATPIRGLILDPKSRLSNFIMEKSQEMQAHSSTKREELTTASQGQATTKKVPRKCIWKRVCLFLKLKPISKVPGHTTGKEEKPLWLETPLETPKLLIDETDYDADDDNSILHRRHIETRARKFSRERCRERRDRFKNRAKDLEARLKRKAEEEPAKSKSRKQEFRERWRRRRAAIRAQLKAWEEHWEWD